MAAKKRTTREPDVSADSPFAPVIAAAEVQIRMLLAGLASLDAEQRALIESRIEGMRSVITTCRRAGAGEIVYEGQNLVRLERAPREPASLEQRVEDLEKRMRALEGAPKRTVPAMLRDVSAAPATSPASSFGKGERRVLTAIAQHVDGVTRSQLDPHRLQTARRATSTSRISVGSSTRVDIASSRRPPASRSSARDSRGSPSVTRFARTGSASSPRANARCSSPLGRVARARNA